MDDIDIVPLIATLIKAFYRSSRDALARVAAASKARTADGPTGFNIFPHRHTETQAALETIVFSFLTVEATINFLFFLQCRDSNMRLDRWLKQKWKRSLSIEDKFVVLFNQYTSIDLGKFQSVTSLFSEFVTFRNRIVHSHPEVYDALVEPSHIPEEILVHDVEPHTTTKNFAHSGLSNEIARIGYEDAARCYEIMLLILAFLDEQFFMELELSWYKIPDQMESMRTARPKEIIQNLESRFYPTIDPTTFSLKSIKWPDREVS